MSFNNNQISSEQSGKTQKIRIAIFCRKNTEKTAYSNLCIIIKFSIKASVDLENHW